MTLWTVAYQAPLSMGFFRQEYWSRLPCPLPVDLPEPGIEPTSKSLALAGSFFTVIATFPVENEVSEPAPLYGDCSSSPLIKFL